MPEDPDKTNHKDNTKLDARSAELESLRKAEADFGLSISRMEGNPFHVPKVLRLKKKHLAQVKARIAELAPEPEVHIPPVPGSKTK